MVDRGGGQPRLNLGLRLARCDRNVKRPITHVPTGSVGAIIAGPNGSPVCPGALVRPNCFNRLELRPEVLWNGYITHTRANVSYGVTLLEVRYLFVEPIRHHRPAIDNDLFDPERPAVVGCRGIDVEQH